MLKMPRNPFQDKINALNSKDLDETLKTQSYLKQSHEPIQDDINNARYTMTDILPPNVLKPEDLSMKDLLDQIQIQTILNNNTPPFIEKKIKSETTQAMIKDFQNEMAKPVEINGTTYKFRPPDLDIDLEVLPPEMPDLATYQANIRSLLRQEFQYQDEIGRRDAQLQDTLRGLVRDLNNGSLSMDEYRRAEAQVNTARQQLDDAVKQSRLEVANLEQQWNQYDEIKLQYDTNRELIDKRNKASLKAYEEELKSRNSGFEVGQQEGESDADYAQRLLDSGNTVVDPAQVEVQARSFAYQSMKDRLNEVLPTYKTEAVLNTIIDAEGYEKLQPIKDQWPALKKKLEEVFGDVARVENTDSIAQVLVSYSLRPAVRPGVPLASAPTPAPVVPSPNITPLPTSIVPAKTIPSVPKIQPSYNLVNTSGTVPTLIGDQFQKGHITRVGNLQKAQELKRIMSSYGPALKEQAFVENEARLREQVLSRQDERRAREFALQQERYRARDAREVAREQQRVLRKYGERLAQERKRGEAITSIDLALEPTARFYPTDIVLHGSASERINQLLAGPPPLEVVGTRRKTVSQQDILQAIQDEELRALAPLRRASTTGAEDLGPRPAPLTQRSKSLEQKIQETGGKSGLPYSVILPSQLIDILEANGLIALRGNNETTKKQNYDRVVQAGLLPPKPNVIARKEITGMSTQEFAEYLTKEGMVGSRGGVAFKGDGTPRPMEDLMKIYDRYAVMYGFGISGVDDIKARFEIIDGEINAGNNNAQLIRDARKLLKEMVQKKMVTLYEAQTHLKHLRSLNKI